MFKKLARWHPVQRSYLRFKFHDNIANYNWESRVRPEHNWDFHFRLRTGSCLELSRWPQSIILILGTKRSNYSKSCSFSWNVCFVCITMVPTKVIIFLQSIIIRGYFILYQKDNANASFWFWQQILSVRRQPGRSSQVREQGGAEALFQVKKAFCWIDAFSELMKGFISMLTIGQQQGLREQMLTRMRTRYKSLNRYTNFKNQRAA